MVPFAGMPALPRAHENGAGGEAIGLKSDFYKPA
jgi:hypothetical protein